MAKNGTLRGLQADLLKMVMETPRRQPAAPARAKPPTPAPQGLPAGVAAVVKACQLDLQPRAARQLDSLVRKRMGVADPMPEPVDDADSQVHDLAERIVRASVAAEIHRIQKGPKS